MEMNIQMKTEFVLFRDYWSQWTAIDMAPGVLLLLQTLWWAMNGVRRIF